MNPRAVPVPWRMRHLECDARGYAIPVTVYRDKGGRPHFTINDEHARQAHILADSCPICGTRLLRGRWFVGGPASAFHEHGSFIDGGMHDECAHYALKVCPWLAAPSYAKRIDARTMPEAERPLTIDPTMIPTRPSVFVALMTTGQRRVWGEVAGLRMVRFLKPRRPYLRVEFWRSGQRLELTDDEIRAIKAEAQAMAAARL